MSYGSSAITSEAWRWMRLDWRILNICSEKHIRQYQQGSFTSSVAAEAPSLMVSSKGASLRRLHMLYESEQEYPKAGFFEFEGKSMGTETAIWSESPNGYKATVVQILGSEERNKSKRAGL